jgi:hypothetical protein
MGEQRMQEEANMMERILAPYLGILIATVIAVVVIPLYIVFIATAGFFLGTPGVVFSATGGLAVMVIVWCCTNSYP